MTCASVTIDASVLAVPTVDADADAVYRYVERLTEWQELLSCPWVSAFKSNDVYDMLFEEGLYPMRPMLQDLLSMYRIREYDANTVARIVDAILDGTRSLEEHFRVSDVLFDGFTTEPDILGDAERESLRKGLARCAVLILLLRHHCPKSIGEHVLVVRNAPDGHVKVEAVVHDLEHIREDLENAFVFPATETGDLPVCADVRGMLACVDEAAMLVQAEEVIDVEAAIWVAANKDRVGRGEDPVLDFGSQMLIGDRFLESVRKNVGSHDVARKLLRAIVETLEGRGAGDTHRLREGSAGGAAPKTRSSDGAEAWRRDVDRKHHLHYWKRGGAEVELAWVSYPHDDCTMPE